MLGILNSFKPMLSHSKFIQHFIALNKYTFMANSTKYLENMDLLEEHKVCGQSKN